MRVRGGRIRAWVAAVSTLVALAAACSEDPVEPEDEVSDEAALPVDAVVDNLDTFDPARWQIMDHALGRGRVASGNVAPTPGVVSLLLPAATFDGAEFRSAQRLPHGVVEGRIRAAAAPGTITAIFLYEGRARRNDEVDIELLGGTRTALFTVWQEDVEVFHRSVTLDFDPAADVHDYRITWTSDRVEWRVDGRLMAEAGGLSLSTDLFLYVNAWWPTWLEGGPSSSGSAAVVDRLVTPRP